MAGQPPKFRKTWIGKCKRMAAKGLTDQQMADELGCSRPTLSAHAKAHPALREALDRGKDIADNKVQRSLYERACGFDWVEVTTETIESEGEEVGMKKVKRVKKKMPPDTGAAFIWLKNRKGKDWRDKQEIDHTVDGKVHYVVKPPREPND